MDFYLPVLCFLAFQNYVLRTDIWISKDSRNTNQNVYTP